MIDTIEEQVCMMWGQEVYRTLNEAGLLVRESVVPTYRKAGVVDDTPTFWVLKADYDGVTPHDASNWLPQGLDNDAKEWARNLFNAPWSHRQQKLPWSPARHFEKAWPENKKGAATRALSMLNNWGKTQGVTARLVPAILTELPT